MISLRKICLSWICKQGWELGRRGRAALFILITVVVTAVVNLRPSRFFLYALRLEKTLTTQQKPNGKFLLIKKKTRSPCCNEKYITFHAAGREKVKTNLKGKGKYSSWLQPAGIQSPVSQKRGALFRGYRLAARAWTAGLGAAQTHRTYKGLLEGDCQTHREQDLAIKDKTERRKGWLE